MDPAGAALSTCGFTGEASHLRPSMAPVRPVRLLVTPATYFMLAVTQLRFLWTTCHEPVLPKSGGPETLNTTLPYTLPLRNTEQT